MRRFLHQFYVLPFARMPRLVLSIVLLVAVCAERYAPRLRSSAEPSSDGRCLSELGAARIGSEGRKCLVMAQEADAGGLGLRGLRWEIIRVNKDTRDNNYILQVLSTQINR